MPTNMWALAELHQLTTLLIPRLPDYGPRPTGPAAYRDLLRKSVHYSHRHELRCSTSSYRSRAYYEFWNDIFISQEFSYASRLTFSSFVKCPIMVCQLRIFPA